MFLLVTHSDGSSMKTWQQAADLCTGQGTTLPIPRSEAEVYALCSSSPNTYIWTGIVKGEEPDSYISYVDQTQAPYLEFIGNCSTCNCEFCTDPNPVDEDKECMALLCYTGVQNQYTFMNTKCDTMGTNYINFCEHRRKYLFVDITYDSTETMFGPTRIRIGPDATYSWSR